ncbi:O-antigen ligase family protein [Mycolicibacterium bacteremicum]|uniref:O-antigen ligase family protein n=1 Tax=Mycolicibacterium bacteremicum TaxID=564198 RepID=UPI0009F1E779|nr:O-antigen ligase family protein [Mycolicibacterium bacteremicum]
MSVGAVQSSTWRLGSASVVLAFALDPLGNIPNVVVLVVIAIAAAQALTMRRTSADPTNIALLALSALVAVIGTLEILNPNVPSLTVGLLGFRKSIAFVLGVVIGLGWLGSRMKGLRLVWWCMFVSASISLAVHLYFPMIAAAIPRSADKYTSLIGGIERMQGLFAGPFHVSMLGVFLVLSAMAPATVIRSGYLRVAAVLVGLGCVYYSQVRTGLVALGVGALVMVLVTGSVKQWVSRLFAFVGLALLAMLYIDPITQYLRQFTALRLLLDGGLDDSRFSQRYKSWSDGWEMIERSPLWGHGSGSAGDTLGPYFAGGYHLTSHNTFLKYAVEGGVLQGVIFIALCVGLAMAVRPSRDVTRFGLAAGLTMLVFGLVGAATEALPVSFGLAVVVGLCAMRKAVTESTAGAQTGRPLAPAPALVPPNKSKGG